MSLNPTLQLPEKNEFIPTEFEIRERPADVRQGSSCLLLFVVFVICFCFLFLFMNAVALSFSVCWCIISFYSSESDLHKCKDHFHLYSFPTVHNI